MKHLVMKRLVTDGSASMPRTARFALVRQWVIDRLGSIRHERRVIRIARGLLDSTTGFHNLTNADRRLMKLAILLHDVGRCENDKHHPEIGARMILEDTTLPLSRRERRALAYLTLHHRGAVPGFGRDAVLREKDDRRRLMDLLAFVRAADALDCRSLPAPALKLSLRRNRLQITCRLQEDSSKARRVFSRRKKLHLLEEVLGCRVDVNIETSRRLQMVA